MRDKRPSSLRPLCAKQVQELSAAIVKADRMLAESAVETERLAGDMAEAEQRYEADLVRLRVALFKSQASYPVTSPSSKREYPSFLRTYHTSHGPSRVFVPCRVRVLLALPSPLLARRKSVMTLKPRSSVCSCPTQWCHLQRRHGSPQALQPEWLRLLPHQE